MNNELLLKLSSKIAYETMIKDLLETNKISSKDDVIYEYKDEISYKKEYQDIFDKYYGFYYNIIKEII